MDDADRYREQRRLAHLALKQLYKSNNDYKKFLKGDADSDEDDETAETPAPVKKEKKAPVTPLGLD